MESDTFLLIGIALACALAGVVALKAMKMSPVPGYFIAGMAAGPFGLNALQESDAVTLAADLGLVLLLFTVGLQLNLTALKSMRRFVFALGGMQFFGTILVVALLARLFTDDWLLASLVGVVAMMSPTAVVNQILLSENAVNSPVGRRAVGVLLFQELFTIPLLIVYASGAVGDSVWSTSALLALKIAATLATVMIVAPRAVKKWLDWIASHGDKEMFALTIVAFLVGSAILTGSLELTFYMGPFLAGILIAETAHRERVEQIIEPFRHLLLGFFFMTVGMLIDLNLFAANWRLIIVLALSLWLIKVPLLFFAVRLCRAHNATALKTGLLMGGGGLFGFVMLAVSKESGILSSEWFQLLVPVNILALVATPFVWSQAERIARRVFPEDDKISARQWEANAAKAAQMQGHAVVCGFGRTGQSLAGILRSLPMEFAAVDNNHLILEAAGGADPLLYGDAHHPDSLLAAGIERAAIVNITFTERATATAAIQAARKLNPNIHIIAKALTPKCAEELRAVGADQALVESHQCGLSMAGQTLRRCHFSEEDLASVFKQARYRDNPIFQGEYLGTGFWESGGETLAGCVVHKSGDGLPPLQAKAAIILWRRGQTTLDPKTDSPLQSGDTLILTGDSAVIKEARVQLASED